MPIWGRPSGRDTQRPRARKACPVLCAAVLAAGAAQAQTLAPADAEGLEEIVITATKRATNLQETPVAVTAITGAALDERGVSDLRDLALSTPGLVVSGSAGFDFPTSIRGISSAASGIGADLPVAIYVDGVYLARGNSAVFGLVDVERIEVLKGPQGTLFGRNATAGAISIVTRAPSDSFEAYGDLTYGRFDEARLRLAVSGPLAPDLAASLSGSIRRRDGFQVNAFDGRRLNAEDSADLRGTLRYDDGGVRLTWRADRGRFETPIANKGIQADPLYTAPINLDVIERVTRNIDEVSNNDLAFSDREEWGTSLTAEIELAERLDLRSISSYRAGRVEFQVDTDGTGLSQLRSNQRYEKQDQLSEELQLVYSGLALDAIAGLYYFREDAETLFFADSYLGNLRQGFNATNVTNSYAAFGEVKWRVAEAIELTAGLRYSEETKAFSNIFEVAPGAPTPATRNRPDAIAFTLPRRFQRKRWNDVSPRFSAAYHVSDDIFVYASVSRGFKSGGFNFTSAQDPPFDPETVWAYELGAKSEWFDRRLRVNVAAYAQSYRDLQVRLASGPGITAFANASNARLRGIEAEATAQLGERTRLEASGAYGRATYRDYVGFAATPGACPGGRFSAADRTCDLSGNNLNRAPEWSLSGALQHGVSLGAGVLTGRVAVAHNSTLYYNDQNTLGHSGWVNVDASIGYAPADGRWELRVWGRNLTDDRYFTFINTVGPAFIGVPNVPLTYGATLSFRL